MPSGIIKGSAMSCCSLGIRTFVARGLCSAASDWVGSCVITTAKRRERVGESPDEFFDHTRVARRLARIGRETRGGRRKSRQGYQPMVLVARLFVFLDLSPPRRSALGAGRAAGGGME